VVVCLAARVAEFLDFVLEEGIAGKLGGQLFQQGDGFFAVFIAEF
jgi:hypothetical protein